MTTIFDFLYDNRSSKKTVSFAIAVEAAKMLLVGELTLGNTCYQHPLIWGDGWYSIFIKDEDEDNGIWYVSPKKFFEEKGYCPDGWEQEIPEEMDEDELEDFIDEFGYEPNAPEGFFYCIESGMRCDKDWSIDEQRNVLRKAGFIVDNVPKWGYERSRK
jgi:hypothetical protein